MSKFYVVILLVFCAISTSWAQKGVAQTGDAAKEKLMSSEVADTAYWDWGNNFGFQFGQTTLRNWSAGGNSQIAINISGNSFANYINRKHIWENQFIGDWGLVRFKGESPQISSNQMEINSQYGYKIGKSWFISALANFKSQFTWGFDYPEDQAKVLISKFAAPAYVKLAPGVTFKPNDIFQVFISPTAGKFTFVREDPRIDETRYGLLAGDIMRGEFGAYARAQLKKELFKNVNFFTILELFNNYTDPNKPNRKNIDVDWQTGLGFTINSWLSANVTTHLIYDQDVEVPVDRDGDGSNEGFGPRTQFKQNLTIGLSYAINKKK